MKFLFDENLPPRLARALDELTSDEHQVVHLRDKFQQGTKDEDWIRALASEGGWCIVTGDRFAKHPGELAAWRESKLTTILLAPAWSSLEFWDKAVKLVKAWPGVESTVAYLAPGATLELRVNGKLSDPTKR